MAADAQVYAWPLPAVATGVGCPWSGMRAPGGPADVGAAAGGLAAVCPPTRCFLYERQSVDGLSEKVLARPLARRRLTFLTAVERKSGRIRVRAPTRPLVLLRDNRPGCRVDS